MQWGRGKSGIKNYRGNHHEFSDFWWKFHDFWTSGAIRIKSDKKNRLIKGWYSIRDLSGYNLGTGV
jgi:hypothetical protein